MPLLDDLREQIKSEVADVKHRNICNFWKYLCVVNIVDELIDRPSTGKPRPLERTAHPGDLRHV